MSTVAEEGRINSILRNRENIWSLITQAKGASKEVLEKMFGSIYPIIDGLEVYDVDNESSEGEQEDDEPEEFFQVNPIQ